MRRAWKDVRMRGFQDEPRSPTPLHLDGSGCRHFERIVLIDQAPGGPATDIVADVAVPRSTARR